MSRLRTRRAASAWRLVSAFNIIVNICHALRGKFTVIAMRKKLKLRPDCDYLCNKKCKRGCDGACGGVWRSQVVGFVMVRLAGKWLQSQ
jgi:hypothetical protein